MEIACPHCGEYNNFSDTVFEESEQKFDCQECEKPIYLGFTPVDDYHNIKEAGNE